MSRKTLVRVLVGMMVAAPVFRIVTMLVCIYAVINLLIDLMYALLDPRIRFD